MLPGLEVAPGEWVCLAGPSGVGKSQTLAALRPGGGGDRPPRVAWTPQAVDDGAPATARVGRWAQAAQGAPWRPWIPPLVHADALGLPADIAWRRFGTLSTGERQRVLVAVAAASPAGAWIADEPTASQDASGRAAVAHLLRAFAASGRAVLVASHDPVLHAAADRVVPLGDVGTFANVWGAAPETPRWVWEGVTVSGRLAPCDGRVVPGLNALTGASGSGKSTLLRVLAGLTPADGGQISWDGRPWRPQERGARGGRRAQWVPAEASCTLRPDRTVGTLVAQVAAAHGVAGPTDAAWNALGLSPSVADLPASLLSGGMAARVALLRALIARPEVLLLDEPTAALDDASTEAVLRTLAAPGGPSVVLAATHDPRWVAACAGRVRLSLDG